VKETIHDGRQAFDEERYSAALRFWTTAAEQLPEGDKRRAKLQESIRVARKKMLEHDVVLLEESEPVVLRSDPGRVVEVLIAAGVCLALALLLAGAVHLSVSVALARAQPDFMVEVGFNEAGLFSTNFMGWPPGELPESILEMTSDKDATVRIARAPEDSPLKSPTRSAMLNAWGWGRTNIVLSGYSDLAHLHVSTRVARGGSNQHSRLGLVAHYHGMEDTVEVVFWASGRVSLHSFGEEGKFSAQANVEQPDGAEGTLIGKYKFWTLHMKTEPGGEDGTLKVSVRLEDPAGTVRKMESREHEYRGGWWVVEDVPVPKGGLQGTAGVQCAVIGGADSPEKGVWFDSIKVQRLDTPSVSGEETGSDE
jgi:hypothetical protein